MIKTAPSLYILSKRIAYLSAFVEYLCCKLEFVLPKSNSGDLNNALNEIVGFEQQKCYRLALRLLKSDSPEALIKAINRCSTRVYGKDKQMLKELLTLNRYKPCIDSDGLLHIKGRLSNFPDLTEELKHP